MILTHRPASPDDIPLLADWNHQLIRDENHRNNMTIPELAERMTTFLQSEYAATIFELNAQPVAYALYRPAEKEIYLRQFFVARAHRRQGIGKAAMQLLINHIWPKDNRLYVEALAAHPAAIAFWRSVGYSDYALTLEIMPKE